MFPEALGDVNEGTWRCHRRHVEMLPKARGDVLEARYLEFTRCRGRNVRRRGVTAKYGYVNTLFTTPFHK
jgi:hypothetical protein